MHARSMVVIALTAASCIITNTTEFDPVPPLTPPRIRDVQGTTRPRLGNLVELRTTDTSVSFYVPVDDVGVTDTLVWQFFINTPRDCDPALKACASPFDGEVMSNESVRRFVEHTIPESRFLDGCNRVELWVSSSFPLRGDRHTPARTGDVDFTTWWVFKQPRGGGTVTDPIESCGHRVQP